MNNARRLAAVSTAILGAVVLAACTPVQQGAGLGGALGAGTGALIGHAYGNTTRGTLIGAGAGAIAGALAGDYHQNYVNPGYRRAPAYYDAGYHAPYPGPVYHSPVAHRPMYVAPSIHYRHRSYHPPYHHGGGATYSSYGHYPACY